jgi:acyl transferase domain-containing protein/NADP-dependent 3-hydroxy acid dehydrogenase YdfG/acyl carrier protein
MQDQEKLIQQLRDALLAIKKLKSDVQIEREKNNEPIAIVGVALRFPGDVNNTDEYWNLLINNIDAIEDIPISRFDVNQYYQKEPALGKITLKQGGFLKDIDLFDASFFDLTRIETESIDPQQRLLLEVSYEALENSGINVNDLTDSNTGVFIGITNVDYQKKHFRSNDYELANPYSYSGVAVAANAGRISYAFGLQGPAVALDTACSSSLVVTHLASQALRNKDCNMAIVGAANIILEPELTMVFSNLNALSSDSRCKPFSNDANGFVRSEGCAVLVLKRLSDAEKDNDNILAIIKGSAVNQDGRSNGFTAPSVTAQTKLLKTALQHAQLQPKDISYIEAHGTGTKIGDPIEMEAITNVFATHKTSQDKLKIGSVKSNIGHTESVAGLAGIIKTALALKHNTLPKSLHFNTPNELIDWNNLPIEIVANNSNWNNNDSYAGISSFGVTGTNAHVILGKHNNSTLIENKTTIRNDIYVLPLSAKNEQALINLANKYIQFIKDAKNELADICAMASLRRAAYNYRSVFVATSKEELIEKLSDFSQLHSDIQKIKFDDEDEIKTVFVFPGQGSQWISMGKNLIENEPVFKQSLEEINQIFKTYVNWDVFEEINNSQSRLNEIDVVQPILIAIQIALANLWISKGIQPDTVIGHSMGEVAAAYIAQKISLQDAAQIICVRSQLMKSLSGKGEMGATDLNIDEANEILKGYEDKLSIAVINSKNSIVLSGDSDALNQVFEQLEQQGKFNRKVKVDVASHSPQMDGILDSLKQKLANITSKHSNIQFYSTVKNKLIINDELDADYWCNNLRKPVQFGNAIQYALQEKNVVFIEMSPHPTLLHAINENIEDSKSNATSIASFVKEKNELSEFYNNYTHLHTLGYKLNFKNIYPNIGAFVILPNYAWQKERYWFDTKPKSPIQSTITPLVTKDDFYEIVWNNIQPTTTTKPSTILLIKDTDGFYKLIEEKLTALHCTVKAIDIDDEITDSDIDIVIHTRSLYTPTDFSLYLECGILSVQKIVQFFSNQSKKPKICCVTNGAFAINNDKEVNLNASLFAGTFSSIQNEHPDFNFLHIDISREINKQEINNISELVFIDKKYKNIAIRGQQVYTSLVQKYTDTSSEKVNVNYNGTYLITGGTSGIGLEYAKWLSTKGVKHIALISRSGEHPETKTALDFIHKNNSSAKIYKADISNFNETSTLLQLIEQSQPKVCGVFHAAAVLEDGLFLNFNKDQFLKPILAKAIGAYNLHQALQQYTLDSFVVCSSAANILGSSAQSNYNAANQMVDSLVAYRRNNNLPATSICWGNIDAIGLAAQDKIRGERLKDQGVGLIYKNELFAYFDFIFSHHSIQYIPLRINFEKWSESNSTLKNNNFFSIVLNTQQPNITEPSILDLNSYDAVIKKIKQTVKDNITIITKIPSAKIKEDDTFKSIGIDSLMALQLKNKLQTIFSVSLNVSSVWAHPTVEKYSIFIAKELKLEDKFIAKQEEIITPIESPKNEVESAVKNLSLEELMKELTSKLD